MIQLEKAVRVANKIVAHHAKAFVAGRAGETYSNSDIIMHCKWQILFRLW